MKNYAIVSLLLLAALCAGAEEYWPQWRRSPTTMASARSWACLLLGV